MLCQKCHKNEATVYYKQNINGVISEYALCDQCAGKGSISLNLNPFGALFTQQQKPRATKRCTLCNTGFDEIKSRGKVGCAECYSVFKNELAPIIANIHSGAKYSGKRQNGAEDKTAEPDQLNSLRLQLKNAIDSEEYELAAQLRDKIKEIERGKNNE